MKRIAKERQYIQRILKSVTRLKMSICLVLSMEAARSENGNGSLGCLNGGGNGCIHIILSVLLISSKPPPFLSLASGLIRRRQCDVFFLFAPLSLPPFSYFGWDSRQLYESEWGLVVGSREMSWVALLLPLFSLLINVLLTPRVLVLGSSTR